MKKESSDGKFTIEIKDGYLNGGKYKRTDKPAIIRLFAKESSVTLQELADAIISCTFYWMGCDNIIDSNKFNKLNIYLYIPKSESTYVTYNFRIPFYSSTNEILPAIACNIRL